MIDAATTFSPRRQTAILVACGLAQFLVTVDYWAIAVALPDMARDLDTRTVDLQWVMSGYILSFSVLLGIAGPLGDRFGRKRMLLIGIGLFGLISTWTGFSNSASMVITARIALGIGGGLLLPLAAAVVADITPSANLPRAMALLTAINAAGAATGPALGGLLTDTLDWRWIFFMNIPFATIAFFMVATLARESRDPDAHGRLDVPGIILIGGALSLLSIGVDRIPHWPTDWWAGTTALGLLLLIAFIICELKVRNPIINLRLLANRVFAGYTVAGMLSNSCWCLLIFTTTLILQKVNHYNAMEAGLFFLYLSASIVISSAIATRLAPRVGTFPLTVAALAFQLVGILLLWIDDQLTMLAIGLMISGVGCAWGWAMPQAGAIVTVPREKVGLASGSILTVMIMGANFMFVVSATLIDSMSGPKGDDYEPGIHATYLLCIALAAIGIVCALGILPWKRINSD